MRTLQIYSQQFSYITYSSVNCIYMWYITSLVPIYLITGSLYLLTAFIQFFLPATPRLW